MQSWYLVDLPGYGFAKVAQSEKNAWIHLLDSYFSADKALECVLLLFDSRHGPTDQDLEALEFFADQGIPIQIVLTKTDQLKTQSERATRKREILEALSAYTLTASDLVWVSVKDKKSIAVLRERLK